MGVKRADVAARQVFRFLPTWYFEGLLTAAAAEPEVIHSSKNLQPAAPHPPQFSGYTFLHKIYLYNQFANLDYSALWANRYHSSSMQFLKKCIAATFMIKVRLIIVLFWLTIDR